MLKPVPLLLALFVPLPAWADTGQSAFQKGAEAVRRKDYDEAIACFTQALWIDPSRPEYHRSRGFARLEKGDYQNAIADFTEAIRLEPKNAESFRGRASAIWAAKVDREAALADYDEALRLDPNNADDHLRRAVILMLQKDADRALRDFNEAIRLQPDFAEAYSLRGEYYLVVRRDADSALEDLNIAIRLDPKLVDAYNFRGAVYAAKKQLELALSDLRHVTRLAPNSADAHDSLGVVYALKKQYEQASAEFNEAIRLNPRLGRAYINRAGALIVRSFEKLPPDSRLGLLDRALADCEEAIRIEPDNAVAYSRRGWARYGKGEWEGAEGDFIKAIGLNGELMSAYEGMTWILASCPEARLRDGKRAVQLAKKYCELTDWQDPKGFELLGAAHAEVGDFTAAVKWQNRALKEAPGRPSELRLQQAEGRLKLYEGGKPFRETEGQAGSPERLPAPAPTDPYVPD